MQYPIIDLIADAYLNNGWTGLDISTGKNLLNPDPNAFIPTPADRTSRYLYQPNIIPANTLANMSFTDNDTSVDISGIYFGFVEDFSDDGSPINFRWIVSNGTVSSDRINRSTSNPNVYCTSAFIYPNNTETINKIFQRYNIQVELGATPTPYEPYGGKNLLSDNFSDYSQSAFYSYITNVVPENEIARFTLTNKDTTIDLSGCYIGFCYEDLSIVGNPSRYKWIINNGVVQSDQTNIYETTFLCRNVFIYPKEKEVFNKIFSRYNVMVELGTIPTPYEPYGGKNDFPNRLKLPLPHYFPHPVIDSLKRALDGTMTNKDREILTHYLTPLGIGGI